MTPDAAPNSLEDALTACLAALLDGDGAALQRLFEQYPDHRAVLRARIAELARLDLLPSDTAGLGAPARLGDFDLLANLGGGGMGLVFLARQRSLKRVAAVKLLRPEMANLGVARERFRREAAAIARLAHPSIVPVLAFGEENGVLFLAMEFLPGLTLAEILRSLKGRRPESVSGESLSSASRPSPASPTVGYVEASLGIVREIALALAHAHERGVLHRDVKPSNVLLTPSGRPVLIDFGLARAEGERQLTSSMSMVGSLPYASPEQLRGAPTDERSDVYSLGTVLYELLALEPPFDGGDELTLRSRILSGSVVPLRKRNRAVSSDVDAVVMTAMDPDPKSRYSSALAFAQDLSNVLALRPIAARPITRWQILLRFARREKALSSAIVLAFLLVTVMPTTLYLFQKRAERELAESFEETQEALKVARRERDAKDAALSELERKLDLEAIGRLQGRADTLWPVTPDTMTREGGMNDWLAESDLVLERLHAVGENSRPVVLFERVVEEIRQRRDLVLEMTRRLEADAEKWLEVNRSLADANAPKGYSGLSIAPQFGLEPIGSDPDSRFLEFAVMQTGDTPQRDERGRLALHDDSALILVLLPAGRFAMGAQRPDPEHPVGTSNVDPNAAENEGPVHEVALDAFFLAKHEMTQAQWLRLSGVNPSRLRRGDAAASRNANSRHPVEQIDYLTSRRILKRAALELPTEAQWEYGARGGTSSIWWSGDDVSSLVGKANLADRALFENSGGDIPHEALLNDGADSHSEVGSYAPNPFGLHDVIGNVREWCLDAFCDYSQPVRTGDGWRTCSEQKQFVARDGSFATIAALAKSASRTPNDPGHKASRLGVRPARAIE